MEDEMIMGKMQEFSETPSQTSKGKTTNSQTENNEHG